MKAFCYKLNAKITLEFDCAGILWEVRANTGAKRSGEWCWDPVEGCLNITSLLVYRMLISPAEREAINAGYKALLAKSIVT